MNVPIRPETTSLDSKNSPGENSEKHLQKVTKGRVSKKKPTLGRKIADTFIAEDVDNVKSFLIFDVIVPTVKNMILDSLELMLLGTTSRTRRGGIRRNVSERASYDTYYDSARSDRRDRGGRFDRRGPRDISDIIFETRMDCEEVIRALEETIDEYGQVSVADLYELSGVDGEFTDNKWGWGRGAKFYPHRVAEGYIIDTPRPERLD